MQSSLGFGGKVDILSKTWSWYLNLQWMKRRKITKMGKESKSLDWYPPSTPKAQFFSVPQLLHLALRAGPPWFLATSIVPPSRGETVLQRHPFILWCWEPAREIPPMTRSRGRDLMNKADQDSLSPWTCSSIYPKTRICLSYYFVPFTNSSDINRGLSPTTFVWKKST